MVGLISRGCQFVGPCTILHTQLSVALQPLHHYCYGWHATDTIVAMQCKKEICKKERFNEGRYKAEKMQCTEVQLTHRRAKVKLYQGSKYYIKSAFVGLFRLSSPSVHAVWFIGILFGSFALFDQFEEGTTKLVLLIQ